ncbi:MAG: hypothetical protein WDO56_28640 [Gammaproteobacteria bacterium]
MSLLRITVRAVAITTLLPLTACHVPASSAPEVRSETAAAVDQARLLEADRDPGQWMMDGRNYTAQRYSPLKQINEQNVSQLGLAWFAELDTFRGVEATPLAIDGVIYNTSAWNITSAYEATTGKLLWTYDPKVPREWGRYACCEPVARGPRGVGNRRSSSARSTAA